MYIKLIKHHFININIISGNLLKNKKGEGKMQKNNNQNQEVELDENHLIQIRKDKLKELQDQGKNPYEITKFDRRNHDVQYLQHGYRHDRGSGSG